VNSSSGFDMLNTSGAIFIKFSGEKLIFYSLSLISVNCKALEINSEREEQFNLVLTASR